MVTNPGASLIPPQGNARVNVFGDARGHHRRAPDRGGLCGHQCVRPNSTLALQRVGMTRSYNGRGHARAT
jgi:hypothetical protein